MARQITKITPLEPVAGDERAEVTYRVQYRNGLWSREYTEVIAGDDAIREACAEAGAHRE